MPSAVISVSGTVFWKKLGLCKTQLPTQAHVPAYVTRPHVERQQHWALWDILMSRASPWRQLLQQADPDSGRE